MNVYYIRHIILIQFHVKYCNFLPENFSCALNQEIHYEISLILWIKGKLNSISAAALQHNEPVFCGHGSK
jgi:hypothetical protein